MFTGLVQTQGQLLHRDARDAGFRLTLQHDFGLVEMGESIAVNGVCLTVAASTQNRFDADCSKETAECTNLGNLAIGSKVHLERALRVGDRLGGHFVTGHVDAKLKLVDSLPQGEALELRFEMPFALRPFIAEKGSITLDGVSLTVNRVSLDDFAVMLVPHTRKSSHLGSLRRGHVVNCEVDVLSRYVVHLAKLDLLTNDKTSDVAKLDLLTNDKTSDDDRDRRLRQALAKAGML